MGAVGGNAATDVVAGSQGAQNAVENNNQAAALRVLGVPAIAAIYCAVDKSCASATDAFKDILAEQMAEAQRERDAIFSDTFKDKGKKDKAAVSTEGGTSTSTPPPPPDDDNNSKIKETYKSIKDAPKFPKGFKDIQNGTTRHNVNNQKVLENLRKVESGQWKKVYKDGFDAAGNRISIHYFQNLRTGKVFDVKVKSGWSNLL